VTARTTTPFHIEGSSRARPEAVRVAYADGSGVGRLREGVDLDLSHWVPNATPARWKADTSTEICLRFAADDGPGSVDLVVNDHVDADGMLSVFSVVHPEIALEHRTVVAAAAASGDFQSWAARPAFRLTQELIEMLRAALARGDDATEIYAVGFDLAIAILRDHAPERAVTGSGWARIEESRRRLDRDVHVERIDDRLVSLRYPPLEGPALAAALVIPQLNALVDDSVWLWPQVRNENWGSDVQLVSIPHGDGWLHDVWLPAYCWAETPNRRSVPGLASTGDSNRWVVEHEPLHRAVDALAAADTGPGRWRVARHLTPFTSVEGRAFPIVVSYTDDQGRPVPSPLDAGRVGAALEGVWST
jgi:hypothetical protein